MIVAEWVVAAKRMDRRQRNGSIGRPIPLADRSSLIAHRSSLLPLALAPVSSSMPPPIAEITMENNAPNHYQILQVQTQVSGWAGGSGRLRQRREGTVG